MASKEQKQIMRDWHDKTGWEFMGFERVRANDPQGFVRAWESNAKWVMDNLNEADSIIAEYRSRHAL